MSDIKQKTLPTGENLYTVGTAEDGAPNVAAFAAVLERMLHTQDGDYIQLTGYLKRNLVEALVFILGAPQGKVS